MLSTYTSTCTYTSDSDPGPGPDPASATPFPKKNPTSKERVLRQYCLKQFLNEHLVEGTGWSCCERTFTSLPEYHLHVRSTHEEELERSYQRELAIRAAARTQSNPFTQRRATKGGSDAVAVECSCGKPGGPPLGTVLLFYKYHPLKAPSAEVERQLDFTTKLHLSGKIRVAEEGINATLAGDQEDVLKYMDWLSEHEMLEGEKLKWGQGSDAEIRSKRKTFFKPSPGCVHVFDGMSVKLVEEICPFGVKNWTPKTLFNPDKQGKVSPKEFHRLVEELVIREPEPERERDHHKEVVLLDVRNYYESRIGHFVNASCPPLRKFSSFPEYIQKNKDHLRGKTILTYCTGGIRCEKATAYIRETIEDPENPATVWMLDGGINNYLEWVDAQGGGVPSHFHGKNYVFDARQGLALPSHKQDHIVSECQFCGNKEDRVVANTRRASSVAGPVAGLGPRSEASASASSVDTRR
ncbi:hypothetical protein K493DRAFT_299224 [Basidiobolus meristosporus CBS 931.73]|uniref:Rhodanese domain-containing protein n=1 Tax=Basidiobolus meristosporus CBS 931.73 TaxID=1314790 RepID=A0A1Y1YNY9_9FUNG|nr:hypothetical protein K493DRAFT_299224 [Basidiobolus meristosporus CBS 931.73]|eukprot:ORX99721.1 hypothetical protein K493DRAFT_299224 [Basidiobolus meristosporus CBS 931.73]